MQFWARYAYIWQNETNRRVAGEITESTQLLRCICRRRPDALRPHALGESLR